MTPELLQKIRLDDPGGTLDAAFAALSMLAEVATLTSANVNIRMVASRFGLIPAELIRQVVEANFPAWVHDAFVGEGLDIAQTSVQDQLKEPIFTTEQVGQLMSFATESRLIYPGIRPGHILEARAL